MLCRKIQGRHQTVLPGPLGRKGGRCDMARKSRKNLPSVIAEAEDSLSV
ncbi:MAG: hypothetical protein K2O40_00445 [Lachnospiraceae bacterium]|nr:hypothetical protein [Lachnospiraceae bacterium]